MRAGTTIAAMTFPLRDSARKDSSKFFNRSDT